MSAKRRLRRKKSTVHHRRMWSLVALLVVFVFSFAVSVSPTTFGLVGSWLALGSAQLLGGSARVVTLLLSLAILVLLTKRKDRQRISLGFILLAVVAVAGWHLTLPGPLRYEWNTWEGNGGGAVGWIFVRALGFIGSSGTLIVLLILAFFAVIAITGASAQKVVTTSLKAIWQGLLALTTALWGFIRQPVSPPVPKVRQRSNPRVKREDHQSADEFEMPQSRPESLAEPEVAYPVEEAPRAVRRALEIPPAKEGPFEQLALPAPPYAHPSLSLLNRGLRQPGGKGSKEERENIRTLEETLSNFGISAKVVDVTRGPTYTRYEIQTAPGTKVSKVKALSNDITMSLASDDVRIEAPIPGKAAIGIEVPNKARTAVTLRDVLDSYEFESSTSNLTVALGKDIEGNTVVADLAQMPHLLIAGATGAGKSVCINSMICSILYKATPDQVKFMLVDPKVVELSTYNGIPHLLAPVLNHPKKAAAALKWAVQEMERRYALFAKTGVRDVERYNELMQERAEAPISQIVIIIDELADLMMVARAEVEDAICRLAQMARAAGMHLVVGTQRPSTDVITGLIKANIPSRLSFTVSSSTDSRVILDVSGAEKLLGRGDMLFLPVGWSKPKRIQGAFVSNREIEKIVDYVSAQGEAQYVQALNTMEEFDAGQQDGELDERFEEAVRVVVEAGQASVSMLQRRMRLGYTRAARIVDQMFDQGIVGPSEGSKPRHVNKNKDIVKAIMERRPS